MKGCPSGAGLKWSNLHARRTTCNLIPNIHPTGIGDNPVSSKGIWGTPVLSKGEWVLCYIKQWTRGTFVSSREGWGYPVSSNTGWSRSTSVSSRRVEVPLFHPGVGVPYFIRWGGKESTLVWRYHSGPAVSLQIMAGPIKSEGNITEWYGLANWLLFPHCGNWLVHVESKNEEQI